MPGNLGRAPESGHRPSGCFWGRAQGPRKEGMVVEEPTADSGRLQTRSKDTNGQPRKPRLRVTKTLEPQQPGTVRLTRQYGEALLCVRYRQDALGLRRYTTVELIVEATPIRPRPQRMVRVDIKLREKALRTCALNAGARWDPKTKLWRMPLGVAEALGIRDRIGK